MKCRKCGGEIPEKRARHNARVCSEKCEHAEAGDSFRRLNPPTGLPTPTTGAIAELVVAADLLSRGGEVFRAVSASCSCDLVVLINGRPLRVEVRTATARLDGEWFCAGSEKADILAMVRLGRIRYVRSAPGHLRCGSGFSLDPMSFFLDGGPVQLDGVIEIPLTMKMAISGEPR